MSEYMEKHSVARLIGAPPGYVGYEEGGQLTEAVRRKPYSVVLFDEIEKAHPDVFNILLQVLDDGRITDSKGKTVDFKNTILIMTSNIGSSYLLEGIDEDGNIKPEAQDMVMNDLKNHFRPEFLNRLDETIMFKPLTKANITNIIDLLVKDLNRRLADKELSVELTSAAKNYVADHGYEPMYGARPLKRYLQKSVYRVDNYKIEKFKWCVWKTAFIPPIKAFFLFSTAVPQLLYIFSCKKQFRMQEYHFVLHFLTVHHTCVP